MKRSLLYILTILSLIACEKKEIPVQAPIPGDLTLNQVEMGSDYRHQLFFNLNENAIVSQNVKTIWDLHFESSPEGHHIKLNSSKLMAAAYFEGYTMEDEITIGDAAWIYDNHNGGLDSTAIGDWMTKDGIYVIDRGLNQAGIHQGYRKMHMNSVSEQHYSITISHLDGSNLEEVILEKRDDVSFVAFSFNPNDHFPIVDPHMDTWDIVFTQYTYVYYDLDPITPYLVVGVLLNPNQARAYMTSAYSFEEIDLEMAAEFVLSEALDEIGHEWKFYNFDEGFYSIESDQIFIIHSAEGVYYKLRFVDFYDDNGVKGAPKFEFQKL